MLIDDLRAAFRPFARPEKVAEMQAYLRTTEPMLGLTVPQTRAVAHAVAREHLGRSPAEHDVLAAATEVWEAAQSRDERRAAIFILVRYARVLSVAAMPTIERFVVDGAWWDLVDALVKAQTSISTNDAEGSAQVMRAWARHESFWVRRYAILSQLQAKATTDTALLADCIVPNLADSEFFVAKAIGWALRDYAKTAPEWVREFVAKHEQQMQPLSKREALKHL
ncbi:DNA alkylation repair protein [Corynebacterium ulceribovis]|uniref:DNA alkylation repair protein n=1 Tax=Corynebacterium ulceribovis TaxID=487732 RepID=UPI000367B3CF|nr:DNA alkylation repair protein [Corynebacterium ulceribovis]